MSAVCAVGTSGTNARVSYTSAADTRVSNASAADTRVSDTGVSNTRVGTANGAGGSTVVTVGVDARVSCVGSTGSVGTVDAEDKS